MSHPCQVRQQQKVAAVSRRGRKHVEGSTLVRERGTELIDDYVRLISRLDQGSGEARQGGHSCSSGSFAATTVAISNA